MEKLIKEIQESIDRYCEQRRLDGTQWSRERVYRVYGIFV